MVVLFVEGLDKDDARRVDCRDSLVIVLVLEGLDKDDVRRVVCRDSLEFIWPVEEGRKPKECWNEKIFV